MGASNTGPNVLAHACTLLPVIPGHLHFFLFWVAEAGAHSGQAGEQMSKTVPSGSAGPPTPLSPMPAMPGKPRLLMLATVQQLDSVSRLVVGEVDSVRAADLG